MFTCTPDTDNMAESVILKWCILLLDWETRRIRSFHKPASSMRSSRKLKLRKERCLTALLYQNNVQIRTWLWMRQKGERFSPTFYWFWVLVGERWWCFFLSQFMNSYKLKLHGPEQTLFLSILSKIKLILYNSSE